MECRLLVSHVRTQPRTVRRRRGQSAAVSRAGEPVVRPSTFGAPVLFVVVGPDVNRASGCLSSEDSGAVASKKVSTVALVHAQQLGQGRCGCMAR